MNDTTWFWQIVDARGLANVSSDEFVALNELINAAERAEAELNAISAAIGSPRFMDPPDGGDVPLAEQVRRMRNALAMSEAAYVGLSSMLLSVQQDCIEVHSALREVMEWINNRSPDFIGAEEWPDTEARILSTLEGSGRNLADANSNHSGESP